MFGNTDDLLPVVLQPTVKAGSHARLSWAIGSSRSRLRRAVQFRVAINRDHFYRGTWDFGTRVLSGRLANLVLLPQKVDLAISGRSPRYEDVREVVMLRSRFAEAWRCARARSDGVSCQPGRAQALVHHGHSRQTETLRDTMNLRRLVAIGTPFGRSSEQEFWRVVTEHRDPRGPEPVSPASGSCSPASRRVSDLDAR